MSNLPAELIESFTEGVERTAARVALRVGLILAGCLAAMLAVIFLFVAAYSGLVILVGPFPAELHEQVVFTAAVAAAAGQADVAQAFITFLKDPSATTLLSARGMIPA